MQRVFDRDQSRFFHEGCGVVRVVFDGFILRGDVYSVQGIVLAFIRCGSGGCEGKEEEKDDEEMLFVHEWLSRVLLCCSFA